MPHKYKGGKDADKTTMYIENLPAVRFHLAEQKETSLKKYVNKLIKEDILATGSETAVEIYFKKTGKTVEDVEKRKLKK